MYVCVSIYPGPQKGKTMHLSTGRARVNSKTDCWVSFDQYMEFARYIHTYVRTYSLTDPVVLSATQWVGHVADGG